MPLAGIDEDKAMDLIAGQRDLDFPPGSAFSYSNSGYVLAAALVRRITGMSLAQFASERVFGPLGMTATAFRDDVGVPVPRLAGGYLAVPSGPEPTGFCRADVTENVVGDGGCVTSLDDLAAWYGLHGRRARAGHRHVRDEPARRADADRRHRNRLRARPRESVEVGGNSAWWHSGSWAGYRSAVLYLARATASA